MGLLPIFSTRGENAVSASLWNTTMPEVFGLKTLTFWQAIKILIIAGILFGGHRVVYTDLPTELPEEPTSATPAGAAD